MNANPNDDADWFFYRDRCRHLLGVAIGSSSAIYNSLYPLLVGFNAVPKVAVVPLIVIWCGIGTVPAIITAFIIYVLPNSGERSNGARERRAGNE